MQYDQIWIYDQNFGFQNFNFMETFPFRLGLLFNCDMSSHSIEAQMPTCHPVDESRPGTEIEDRLPRGQAIVVIASLSAFSWAVLIAIVMGLRAVL